MASPPPARLALGALVALVLVLAVLWAWKNAPCPPADAFRAGAPAPGRCSCPRGAPVPADESCCAGASHPDAAAEYRTLVGLGAVPGGAVGDHAPLSLRACPDDPASTGGLNRSPIREAGAAVAAGIELGALAVANGRR